MKADPLLWGAHPESVEIESKRSRHAKHFLRPDGKIDAVFGTHVHYETATGWDDVDLSFRADGQDHIMDRHIVNARVNAQGVAAWDRATGKGVRWLTPVRPTVAGRRAQFAQGGLAWSYATRKSGLKLEASVTAPLGAKSFTFPYLLLGGAADFVERADGGLTGDGFAVLPPVFYGRSGQAYTCGRMRLLSGPRVALDYDDAAIPADEFPGVLDPTTNFSVAANADDGAVTKYEDFVYPPTANNTASTTGTRLDVRRSKSSNTYEIKVGLMRWDTSALSGQTVTSALARFYTPVASSADARSLTAGYYASSNWPIDTADWAETAETDAHAGTAIASITAAASNDFALANVSNINTTGYTGLRWHISGGIPTGTNAVLISALDHATETEPILVVTHEAAGGTTFTKHRPMRPGFKW